MANSWSEEEVKALKRLYPSEATREEIGSVINRSWYATQKKAQSLGLKKSRLSPINQANLDKVVRKYKI